MRDSEEISYGFLATKASIALRNALANHLSGEDQLALYRAATLLDEIAQGAMRTKGTVIQGVRPSRSIAALKIALGPLDTLKRLVQNDNADIVPVFQRLATAVKAVHSGESPTRYRPELRDAHEFFEGLSGWLTNELAARKRLGRSKSSRTTEY